MSILQTKGSFQLAFESSEFSTASNATSSRVVQLSGLYKLRLKGVSFTSANINAVLNGNSLWSGSFTWLLSSPQFKTPLVPSAPGFLFCNLANQPSGYPDPLTTSSSAWKFDSYIGDPVGTEMLCQFNGYLQLQLLGHWGGINAPVGIKTNSNDPEYYLVYNQPFSTIVGSVQSQIIFNFEYEKI